MNYSDIDTVFRKYGPLVYRRALRILKNEAEASDAVNEVFIRVMNSVEAFEQRCDFVVWLNRITTNYCLNRIRNSKRREELIQEKIQPAENQKNNDKHPESALVIHRLLAEADERQALAACYVFIEGMSHEEAAELMGVSRRTLGNLVERFVIWSREVLENEN